jgi:TIGR03009 family protein
MSLFRGSVIISITVLYFAAAVSAQTGTVPQQQPMMQQPRLQQEQQRQDPIRLQPFKTPPISVVQNGVTISQQDPNQPNLSNRTMPAGFGTPYPTGLQPNQPVKAAMSQTDPTANLMTVNPITVQGQEPQRVHVGRAEPPNKVIPFFLNPDEQKELDDFLVRWEKYSTSIKRYDVDFYMFIYDPTIPGAEPNKPYKTTFGYFKYIANPLRFVYHVEGEWIKDAKVKRDGDKNPLVFAEKLIIDEKSVYKYEYNAKTVLQVNVPPEMIGKGIADSPLPLIFGAKAADLKRRFSMKIMSPSSQNETIWLQAKPLQIEDQQEFSMLEIILDKKTLQAKGLRKYDINNKTYWVYDLKSPAINGRMNQILDDLKTWFTPTVEKGWKHEINDWVLEAANSRPAAAPAPNQAPNTRPIGNAAQRNEIPLYQPQ